MNRITCSKTSAFSSAMTLWTSRSARHFASSCVIRDPQASPATRQDPLPFSEIPGPKSYPFIENLLALKQYGGDLNVSEITEFGFDINRKYGDIVKFGVMSKPEVFVFNPESVKKIFTQNEKHPKRKMVTPWLKYYQVKNMPVSLSTSDNEEWRHLRSYLNPIIARQDIVQSYIQRHGVVIDNMIDYLKSQFDDKQNVLEAKQFERTIKYLAFELITMITFNKPIECVNHQKRTPEVQEFIDLLEKWVRQTAELLFGSPLWQKVPTKAWKEFEHVSDRFFEKLVFYLKQAYTELDQTTPSDPNRVPTILEEILRTKDKFTMTPQAIDTVMSELIFAAIDTVTASLSFMLAELGRNTDIQKDLYDEIIRTTGGGKKELINAESLDKMVLLKAIVKETYRMYAMASILGREAQQDMVLDGYLVPKGTFVNVVPIVIGRSEKYFKEPNKFLPKRWLGDREAHPFTVIPFGFGPRSCIGQQLARQEMYLTLIKLVLNFEIEYTGGDFGIRNGTNLYPNKPVDLKLKKRA